MILIGEILNSTRKNVRRALSQKDEKYIADLALEQEAAGASYIDVNAGAFAERELEYLEWMIGVIRRATSCPLCIDSAAPEALALGCRLAGGDLLVNSISAEKQRFRSVLPIVTEFNAGVIALAMDDSGLTDDEERMFVTATRLVNDLLAEGIPLERIFLDPLVRPISTNTRYGIIVLNLLRRIRKEYAGIHCVCGLSNVSFGLPKRKIINRAFVLMAMSSGLDAAILDPLDRVMMAQIRAAESLLDRDPFCMNFIGAATKHPVHNVRRHPGRKADNIQGRQRCPAHSVDIGEGIGGGNLPE